MDRAQITFDAADQAATDRLGAALAESLPPRCVIALIGTLGAGKTRLVQAVATAAGVAAGEVTSPTFVLIQHYQGVQPIYHFDTYRLRDEDEFLDLGPEEYFERPGWSFVEWADRVQRCLPPKHVEIRIEVTGDQSRRFRITAPAEVLEPLRGRVASG